jgi:integrase
LHLPKRGWLPLGNHPLTAFQRNGLVDRIAGRAGWKKGELGTRVFRHKWTAARLQTLDHRAPVSIYTVSRELGHGSEEMVRRVYAQLGTVRHRSEVVEFRVEQHLEALKDRLGNVGFCYP